MPDGVAYRVMKKLGAVAVENGGQQVDRYLGFLMVERLGILAGLYTMGRSPGIGQA